MGAVRAMISGVALRIGLNQVITMPRAMPMTAPMASTRAAAWARCGSSEAKEKPSLAIGDMSGETSMAPMTTALDDCSSPSVAMAADSAHISA